MKRGLISFICLLVVVLFSVPFLLNADDRYLEGDKKDACEALMCLSSGKRPHECEPSLRRYFSIHDKKPWKTMQKRRDFLKMCPKASDDGNDSQMSTLADAIVDGAGRCDAKSLNTNKTSVYKDGKYINVIDNRIPSYCTNYFNHKYTDFSGDVPVYVGTPEEEGFWVEPTDYETALAEYNRKQEEKRQYELLHPLCRYSLGN